MPRDHPMLVQQSMYRTQGWRANGDISLILSKSSPANSSNEDIIATEKCITGYACKGNEPAGAVMEFFNDTANSADESTGASAQSVCTKLLMKTKQLDETSRAWTHRFTLIQVQPSVPKSQFFRVTCPRTYWYQSHKKYTPWKISQSPRSGPMFLVSVCFQTREGTCHQWKQY